MHGLYTLNLKSALCMFSVHAATLCVAWHTANTAGAEVKHRNQKACMPCSFTSGLSTWDWDQCSGLFRLGLGDKLQLACTEKKGRAQAIQVHGASVMLPTGMPFSLAFQMFL